MMFDVIESYAKKQFDRDVWVALNISRSTWFRYRKDNRLPLDECKTVCSWFNHHITDDQKTLTLLAVEGYYGCSK